MSVLHNLLEKLGLKYEDLTAEEKKSYDEYTQILSQPEITIDDLKGFIPSQIERLESEQNDYRNTKEKDLFLKAQIRNLKMIHSFIQGPEARKKWLEETLNKQLSK
jgi:uncharacterized protein (UPF0335 family)